MEIYLFKLVHKEWHRHPNISTPIQTLTLLISHMRLSFNLTFLFTMLWCSYRQSAGLTKQRKNTAAPLHSNGRMNARANHTLQCVSWLMWLLQKRLDSRYESWFDYICAIYLGPSLINHEIINIIIAEKTFGLKYLCCCFQNICGFTHSFVLLYVNYIPRLYQLIIDYTWEHIPLLNMTVNWLSQHM